MRTPGVLPLALLAALTSHALLTTARTAAADDGAALRRVPYAPIAGTPIPGTMDLSPDKKAKYPGLVIGGAVAVSLGAAGALAGMVLMSTDETGCFASGVEPCTKPRRDIGVTTLSISAAVAAAGLAMVLVGVQPADEPASAKARLVPQIAVGPTGGALTWRF